MIIDEHPIVRKGVRSLLEAAWDRADVSDFPTPADAVEEGGSGSPDVVIVDPWRAGADIGELVKRLTGELDAPVVIFTADGGARLLTEALKAGARGYVRKDSPSGDLVRAIKATSAGELYVDPSLSSMIVLEDGDRTLSARQRQILEMLANGTQTEAVATALGLSTETVRTHTKRILAKLQASTRTQAVAIGLRYGLIE
ncbi:MAG: LuxR C-terminal-related transcriptional regulator [Thermoleophilaceae bacterium]